MGFIEKMTEMCWLQAQKSKFTHNQGLHFPAYHVCLTVSQQQQQFKMLAS